MGKGKVSTSTVEKRAKKNGMKSQTSSYLVRRLSNENGTCYMNVILQNLLSIDVLRNHFVHATDDTFGSLTTSVRELFLLTSLPVGPRPSRINTITIDPTPVFLSMTSIKSTRYVVGRGGGFPMTFMEDLVKGLSQEERSKRGDDDDDHPAFMETMFRVQFSSIMCSACGFSEENRTRFGLRLDVPYLHNNKRIEKPKNPSTGEIKNKSVHKHMMAILNLTESKKVSSKSANKTSTNPDGDGDHVEVSRHASVSIESYLDSYMMKKCANCPFSNIRKREATKIKLLIKKAPRILIIELDYCVAIHNDELVVHGEVEFGETLDIKPYMDPTCIDKNDTYRYRLIGMIEETMIEHVGHNFAFVRGTNSKGICAWYVVDDNMIRKLSVKEILASKPETLFYERC